MNIKNLDRRTFVKATVGSLATIPLIVRAESEVIRLAEDDATAVALGYKEKSSDVNAEKFPNHNVKQLCSDCSLYANDENGWGDCAIFPAKKVAAGGWCTAYAAKPS